MKIINHEKDGSFKLEFPYAEIDFVSSLLDLAVNDCLGEYRIPENINDVFDYLEKNKENKNESGGLFLNFSSDAHGFIIALMEEVVAYYEENNINASKMQSSIDFIKLDVTSTVLH